MAALTAKRLVRVKTMKSVELAATASVSYFQGGLACFDTSTGLVKKGQASTTLIPIGLFAEDKTLGAGGGTVLVRLFREIQAGWFVNDASVVAADIGGLAYILDDQTVANSDATNTRSVLGRIWAIDTVKGVLVEPRDTAGQAVETGLDA